VGRTTGIDRPGLSGNAGRGRAARPVPCPAMADLEAQIDALWERRDSIDVDDPDVQRPIREAVALLDAGEARVAEWVDDGDVVVNQWLKRAILLLFKISKMQTIELGPFEYADKIPLKSSYEAAGVRVVPGASARWGSFLDRGAVMMPSYVNIGARVGAGTMVDTWATVGSCAQIGANVHLSGGVGIGGVLEPPQAAPVMVGDDAFIGSRCMIVDGARVGEGAKLGAGVILSSSIPVYDAETGEELSRGIVPPWCVAIQATREREFPGGTWGLPCVLVISRLAPGEAHDKLQLEAALREHGALA
jgi:2,3,4,5-tetrahydropyridine-2-carboxylate N-succinyltransferase